jgi:hypothetical protein
MEDQIKICKDCKACVLGYFKSKPDEYVCIGVKTPFIVNNINNACTEYSPIKKVLRGKR